MLNLKLIVQRPKQKARIKRYFGGLKSPYASDANWFWRFFRNREKALFCDLVCSLEKENCLDLGAGSCEYSKTLLNMDTKRSVCVDFTPSFMSEVRHPGIEKIFCDVETYQTDRKYDLILCLGIVEFLDHPENFMLQLKDFLKPTGRIIILLPLSKIGSFVYTFVYLLKGIVIHTLTLKRMNCLLIRKGFFLEKTAKNIFSGFAIYSIQQNQFHKKK